MSTRMDQTWHDMLCESPDFPDCDDNPREEEEMEWWEAKSRIEPDMTADDFVEKWYGNLRTWVIDSYFPAREDPYEAEYVTVRDDNEASILDNEIAELFGIDYTKLLLIAEMYEENVGDFDSDDTYSFIIRENDDPAEEKALNDYLLENYPTLYDYRQEMMGSKVFCYPADYLPEWWQDLKDHVAEHFEDRDVQDEVCEAIYDLYN